MALQAYKEKTFKANISFEDESVKEVVFRLPRNTDAYSSPDGNSNVDLLYTLANMAKPFEKHVQVEVEDGSLLNIKTVRELVDLGVIINFTDAISKWYDERAKAAEEKANLVKKSKSAGGSDKKDTPQAKN